MIQKAFITSLSNYAPKRSVLLWNEVEQAYTSDKRHYHTLDHLNHLLNELTPFQMRFHHWDTIVFAIAYHDIVYNALNQDNELKSAELAVNRLQTISFPEKEAVHCRRLIMATQKHEPGDLEVDLFTDADLSILGAVPDMYRQYSSQVRKEYHIYPDIIYNPGRKKVLNHFLTMPRIFKTIEFFKKYEENARINLKEELEVLK